MFLSSFSRFTVQSQTEVFKAENWSSFFSEQSTGFGQQRTAGHGSEVPVVAAQSGLRAVPPVSHFPLPLAPLPALVSLEGGKPGEQKLGSFPFSSFQKYDVVSVMLKLISRF